MYDNHFKISLLILTALHKYGTWFYSTFSKKAKLMVIRVGEN